MRFRLLGSLEVDDVAEPALLGRTKVRAVLAMLLLDANRPVSVDRLVEGLWADAPPPTAHGALQNYVSQLRKALGPEVIVTRPPGYVASVEADDLDVSVFERLVAEAPSLDVGERAAVLREALDLWRGPPLDDLADEPFAGAEIRRLEGLRRGAIEDRVAAELELGRDAELLPELDAAIEEEPMGERLRALRMLALYRAGRQADALATYQEIRAVLGEIGLEPGEELRRLERAILQQDPEIAAPARPSPAEPPPRAGRRDRRTVTIVFADVSGSTVLGETLDPETLRDVMASFFGEMRGAIGRHGGTVEKFAGDEVMAIFGAPVAHEDDALRAVRATEEMRAAVNDLDRSLRSEHGVPFRARIGINTGEVVAGEASAGGTFVTGAAVNVGKRLQELAQPGETVLSGATLQLVRDAVEVEPLGSVQLRGTDRAVEAFRLEAVRADQPGVVRAFETPLVGRRRELDVLRSAFELARNERRCVFVTVVGGAGIGKTRVVRELVELLGDDARVLVGRCVPYGHGATYLPVVDALGDALEDVRRLHGQGDHVVGRLSALLHDEQTTATAADTAWSARRALEALARERPLLVVFDDVHWGEATFLDLLEYLGAWIGDAPVLLVAVARPDLLETRPAWADPEAGVAPLRLAPLDAAETRTLVDGLAEDTLSEPERQRVAELAEGYPLFAEQLVAWAADAGGELGAAEMPPTVEALLASRLDRLDPGERAVLERASVVGRDFWHGAVAALTPPRELGGVGRHLLGLVRKGLVRPAASELPAEDALRFHHVLVRDVAYAGIPKEHRAELHERCADWLDANAGEPDEVVGYHLERAHVFRRELGDSGRITSRLGADAGERLGRAGVRALARGDAPAAVNLLGRATDVLPRADPRRVELLCELALSQRFADIELAEATLVRAVAEAEDARDRRLELRARLELGVARLVMHRESPDEIGAVARAALPVFEALNDDRSLARLWFLTSWVQGSFACQNAAWEEGTERALVHYRRAGWPTSTCLNGIGPALFFGPRPAAPATARCDELLGDAETDVIGRAHITLWRAGLVALQGRFDEARVGAAAARRTYEEHGHRLTAVSACGFVEGMTEMLAGDYAAAEAHMREDAAFLEAHGEHAHLANRAAELAGALLAQGRRDEAIEWSELAVRQSDEHDVSAQFTSRSVHATVLAENGQVEDAEELARGALELVDRTDALNQRADVRLALAQVVRRGSRADEAPAIAREAAALYEQKGNVVSAARALELVR